MTQTIKEGWPPYPAKFELTKKKEDLLVGLWRNGKNVQESVGILTKRYGSRQGVKGRKKLFKKNKRKGPSRADEEFVRKRFHKIGEWQMCLMLGKYGRK